jgi:hypothetical protein
MIVVSMALLVSILAIFAIYHGDSTDYVIDWKPPGSIVIDTVEADAENETLIVTFWLIDSEGRVTKWDGLLRVELTDENQEPVLNRTYEVAASHFKDKLDGNILDTYYCLRIPFFELDHVTEGIRNSPDISVSVRLSFTIGDHVLVEDCWWWAPPTAVEVGNVFVDEEDEELLVQVMLYDDDSRTTKWSGDLRLIIWDSKDSEMYNVSEEIRAKDFSGIYIGRAASLWYFHTVPFENMTKSKDRLNDSGDVNACMMRTFAWFTFDGMTLSQNPNASITMRASEEIPSALLLGNEPPQPQLETDRWDFTGNKHFFNATGTTDDLGPKGLIYEWTWSDGSSPEITHLPCSNHTFSEAGTYTVVLTVIDLEGASSSVNVSVDILRDLDDITEPEKPGEKLPNSFPVRRLRKSISDPGALLFSMDG